MGVDGTRHIIVTDHDASWVRMFEEEAEKIRAMFKDEVVAIHHIGSTAVPNLKAKPIIDILPVVKNIADVDAHQGKMKELGYEALGEFGLRGRRFFRKGGVSRTHHVHIYQSDHEREIERHVAVRDYLRAHRQAAMEYGNLKEKLAEKFPQDSEGYRNGKAAFVQNLEHRAMEWKFS